VAVVHKTDHCESTTVITVNPVFQQAVVTYTP